MRCGVTETDQTDLEHALGGMIDNSTLILHGLHSADEMYLYILEVDQPQ